MILSDGNIKAAIAAGSIVVSPYDEAMINPSSLDIRLGDMYTETRPEYQPMNGNGRVDPLDKKTFVTTTTKQNSYLLKARSTVLVSMLEHLELPDNISAKLLGKSSLARLGMDNSSPAGWIDAGWRGYITMELTNHAHYDLQLTKGMKIGQLVFFAHTPSEKPYSQTGRYYDQSAGQGSRGV